MSNRKLTRHDYRVIRQGADLMVVEVYYDEEGRPETYAETPFSPVVSGELSELEFELTQVAGALKKPILDVKDFGSPPTTTG